jgi:acyl-coenzyme A synthetase/AMP-(fatty) acid ligase
MSRRSACRTTSGAKRSVDFTDELPRQDNGKIYKRLLRDRYRTTAAG